MEEEEYKVVPIPKFAKYEVSREGRFRSCGKAYEPYRSHGTYYLVAYDRGKRYVLNAAKAVAAAWINDYRYPGEVVRKNGNKYDIRADNLLPCDECALSVYYGQKSRQAIRRYEAKIMDGKEAYSMAESELQICRRLLDNGDATELADYIKSSMMDDEVRRIMDINAYSYERAMMLVVNAVAILIERISGGAFVVNLRKEIRKLIKDIRRGGVQ